jgi:hypothetical protein
MSYTEYSYNILTHVTDTWAHRQGRSPEIELTDGSTAVSSAISETPENDQFWSKHVVYNAPLM